MSKQNFDSEELVKLFHKIHQRLDWLTCAIKECCSKIPINIGDGIGLFKRLANNKWEFKSLVEGDNITITQTNEEIIISSQATPFSCSDLNSCSTSNLQEGSRLYFTDGRAVTALTGQNISLFINNSGYITSSALSPYLTITSAASTYQPIGSYLTEAVADTKYYSITNPSSFITSSALTPYLLSSTASSTYEPIITPGTISQYYRGDKTFQTLDKTAVGLSNVDNTSDANKPISTATQTALDLKADKTEVSIVLFKSITQTIVTGKSLETSIYAIPLPMDGAEYMLKVYSQAQISTFAGAGISHRLRVGSYASPIDGSSGANSIGQQTLIAVNGVASATQFPLSRNGFIFKGGASGSIYGISTASNIPDDANSLASFSTLASKDFTIQHYLYVTFNPSNTGAVVTHNQILVTLIKI